MSKPFTYWVRLAMVATMCTLVTFSPVSAGRWMDRLLHRDACKTQVSNCDESANSCDSSCLAVTAAPCQTACAPAACAPLACSPAPSTACDAMPIAPAAVVEAKPAPMMPKTVDPVPLAVEAPKATTPKVAAPVPAIVTPPPVAEQPKVIAEPAPVVEQPKVVEQPNVVVESAVPELAPVVVTPAPVAVKPAPVAAEPLAPNPFDAPAARAPVDDLFGDAPAADAPAAKAPAVDDLFGDAPAANAPAAKAPVDDLFGDAPAPNAPAADAPAAKAPVVDDLFGDAPAADAPVAKTPVDDLFGDAPAAKVPTGEPDVPAAIPAKTELDDLFGNPPVPKSTPAEPSIEDLFGSDPKPATPAAPAVGAPVESKPVGGLDDLFKTKDKPVAAPESSIDDLFGKPIATEAKADQPMPAAELIDDGKFIDSLFGKTPVTSAPDATKPKAPKSTIEKPLKPAPAVREPAGTKEPVVDDLDALFGVGAYTPDSEFNGAEYRLWVDNSGAYQIKGRLAVIYVDRVKLLKENGKFTTVPLSRLSDADFGYVSWVASNLTSEQTARMVKTESKSFDNDAR